MATGRTISLRLGVEGASDIKAALEAVGNTGTASFDKIRSGLERLGATSTDAVAAMDRIRQAAERVQTATAQAQVAAFAGIKRASDADDYQARAKDVAAYGAQLDALRARFNPLYAASKQYETLLDDISGAERVGAISSGEAAAARDRATKAFSDATQPIGQHKQALDAVTVSSGAAAAATRNLGIQVVQGISGIATGQPVFQTLIQQGHQVVDSSLAMGTGFGTVAQSAKGLFSAIGGLPTLLAAGVVGGLIAVTSAAESNANRMGDLRQALRLTHDDYAALADQVDASARRVAASSTLTRSAAEDIGKAIASSQYLGSYTGQLDQLTKSASGFARVAGVDGVQAGQHFRDAIDQPYEEARKLADLGLPAMDAALLRSIQLLDMSGQHAQATALVMQVLGKASSGAAADVSPLSSALTGLSNALTGTNDGFKGLGDALGNSIADLVKSTTTDIQNLLALAQKVKGLVSSGPLLDANTGKTPNASADLQRVAPYIASRIYQIAEANGISPNIADLGTRVAYQESRGQQIDPRTGGVLTSSTGALGVMQLMPTTASGLGVDPTNVDQNILGGLRYLAQLSADPRFRNEADVAGAYNMGPSGYAAVQAGQRRLPSETAAYQQSVAGGPGTAANPIQLSPVSVSGLPESVQRLLKANPSAGTVLSGQQEADAKIGALVEAIGDLDAAGQKTGPVMDDLQARLAKARGEFANAISPIDAVTRGITDSLAPMQAQSGAARAVAEAINQQGLAARSSGQVLSSDQAEAAKAATLQKLSLTYQDNVQAIDRQIDAQGKVNAAYVASGGSVIEATARTKAEADARETAEPKTRAYADQVEVLTARYVRLAGAQNALAQIQDNRKVSDQIAYVQAEIDTVGMDAAARTKLLAVMQAEQTEHQKYGTTLPAESQERIRLAGVLADTTAAYQHQQQVMGDLTGAVSSAADQIGTSLTDAFVKGEASGVSFTSVMQGIETQIVSLIAKLALVNPLLNAIDGGTRTTLGDVGGLLGGLLGLGGGGSLIGLAAKATGSLVTSNSAGAAIDGTAMLDRLGIDAGTTTAASSAGSSGGLLSNLGTASTVAKGLDWLSGGKLLGAVKDYVFNAIGYTPGTSIGAYVSGLIGETTPVTEAAGAIAAGVPGAASDVGSLGASIATGAGTDAAVGAIGSAAQTIANALPYIGVAISLVTELASGNYRGAGLVAGGALLGAAIGSVVPVIGTAVGAAAGAVIGGLVDTFFPQHPKNPYVDAQLTATNGQLGLGTVVGQLTDTKPYADEVTQYAGAVNDYLARVNLKIANEGLIGSIGSNVKGTNQLDAKDISQLFGRLGFTSVDTSSTFGLAEQGALDGMRFADPTQLQNELVKIANFSDGLDNLGIKLGAVGTDLKNIQIAGVSGVGNGTQFQTALNTDLAGKTFADPDALNAEINKVATFVTSTLPSLFDPHIQQAASDTQKGIQAIYEAYQAASTQAQAYGLSIEGLAHMADVAVQQYIAPAVHALQLQDYSIQARNLRAGGSTADNEQADLIDFDVKVDQELSTYSKLLTDVYGGAYAQTAEYAAQIAYLQETEGKERVEIIQKYADQATQATQQAAAAQAQAVTQAQQSASSVVVSLRDYLRGLETGSDSILSPQAQLDAAQRQFQAVSGAAQAGDANSIGQLQSVSSTYEAAAKAVFGSGVGTAAVVQAIADAVGGVVGQGADALTASFLAQQVQSQTQTLVDALAAVQAEVAALRRENQQLARTMALAA